MDKEKERRVLWAFIKTHEVWGMDLDVDPKVVSQKCIHDMIQQLIEHANERVLPKNETGNAEKIDSIHRGGVRERQSKSGES